MLLAEDVKRLAKLQEQLYAQHDTALLVIFQAMDAAGKDSAIEHVMSGINPQGCEVHAFKAPSPMELDHDFLWRTTRRCRERGHIGIFNRSYYEEVLVVRVHPEMLGREKLPPKLVTKHIWKERFEDIRAFERHLVRNGTVIAEIPPARLEGGAEARFLDASTTPTSSGSSRRTMSPSGDDGTTTWRAYEDMIRAHQHRGGALARRAGGQQVVHPAGRRANPGRHTGADRSEVSRQVDAAALAELKDARAKLLKEGVAASQARRVEARIAGPLAERPAISAKKPRAGGVYASLTSIRDPSGYVATES